MSRASVVGELWKAEFARLLMDVVEEFALASGTNVAFYSVRVSEELL